MGDLRVVTRTGAEASLPEAAVAEFMAGLRGPALLAGDEGYDEARLLWNGFFDKRPALIARCTGAADVVKAVSFARDHDLLLAIKGGGHNIAGTGSCDGGLMVDLSLMRGVRVDPAARTVRAGGGATWGDVDRETQVFGLAAPGGLVSTTGVAGLTLNGGIGWLRRKHGLSCDNLVLVDIVTADGQLRVASGRENHDLFWAVRGGGGNFGVVTSFEYRAHPVGPIVALAAPFYPAEKAAPLLRAWRDFAAASPDEVTSMALFWNVPEAPAFPEGARGKPVLILAAVYAGPAEEGARVLQPLREWETPLVDLSGPLPYTAVQSAFDPFFPKGELRCYWKSLYLDRLSDEVIAAMVARAASRPSPQSDLLAMHLGGAMGRMGPEETAFGRRDAAFLLSVESTWEDPRDTDRNLAWAREGWAEMRAFSPGGLYLNFAGFGEEKEQLVREAYGANYDRLAALKKQYDPTNLFHLNQNIAPAP